MELFLPILLGAIQGLTELWPISSSAHLFLLPFLMGKEDPGLTMSVFLHFGTLIAILIYFYKDWLAIMSRQKRLLYIIILSTIPAAIAGLLLEDLAETVFRNPVIVIINLIVFGLILGWADNYITKSNNSTNLDNLTIWQGIIIGIAQTLALVPGVSRSGASISAGLFLNLNRSQAAKFSFLLLTPTLIGASILRGWDLVQTGFSSVGMAILPAMIGLIASVVFSYLALYYLFRWLKKSSFWPFVFYRIILALIVLLVYLS
jgi:undecaprenyl-diphosphatase